MTIMTKEQAESLAKHERTYRARKIKGHWVVWCDASDHVVEFDIIPEIEPLQSLAMGAKRKIFQITGRGL